MPDVQVFDLPPPDEAQPTTLFDVPDPLKSNTLPDDQTKMTSTLAAFSQKMNGLSDQAMADQQQIFETKIKEGQESEVRSQVAEEQRQRSISDLQTLQAEALTTNPQDYALGDAFHAEQAAAEAPPNQSAVEEDGTKAMQGMQPTGDSGALGAYLGAARREQSDYSAKVAIYNAEMSRLKGDVDQEGVPGKVSDFLFGMTGLEDLLVDSHLVKGQGTYFKTPANNLNDQMRFLWSQSPEKFKALMDEAIGHSKWWWGAGPTYSAMAKLGGAQIGGFAQSALGYNFWTYAGPAAYLPVAKMTKFASGMARVVGNRELSTNMVTAGIAATSAGVPTGLEHVQPIEASIAETIPSVSIPDTASLARGDVGVVSDVADRLDALRQATEAAKATLARTPRLDASQVKEMINKGIKTIENTYRDSPVADIKRDVTEPNIVANTEPGKPWVQTRPSTGKEFIRAVRPLTDILGDIRQAKGFSRFTAEQADHIIGEHLYADEFTHNGEHGFSLSEADHITDNHLYLDEFDLDHLAAINEEGELRPATAVRHEGQSKVSFAVDNDTDIDSLSHWNSRGEIYHDTPADKTFRSNPFVLQQEHDLEVATLAREGSQKAMAPKGGSFGQNELHSASLDARDNRFVVARKMSDGSIKTGKPGDMHFNLYSQKELDNPDFDSNAPGGYDSMGFADKSGKFYTRAEAAAALNQPGRLESVRYQEDISPSFGRRGTTPETGNLGGVRSVPELMQSPSTGLYSLKFYVGKDQTTGGFLTAEGAAAAAVRRGFENPKIIQTLDGHWYIEANHVLPETGLTTKTVRAEDFPAVYKPAEFVKSLDGLQAMVHNELRKGAVLNRGRLLKDVYGPYIKNIKKLSGSQTDTLSSVLRSGEAEGKWFSMPELYDKYNALAGRTPTYKESLAYYSAKEISDLNYHIFNDRLYVPMAREGYETMSVTVPETGFDTGRMNAREIPAEQARGQRIYVADTGDISDGIRKDVQAMIDTGHYKMLERRDTMMHEGRPVKFILAHNDSLERGPLERQQLTYNEGGSREYANKWFTKQANYIDDADGHRTWIDPLTHVTGPTRKSLVSWTEGMERARLAYTDPNLSEAEKRLVIDATPIESYDKFDEMVKSGKIHPATPFEIVGDNQLPQALIRVGDTNWTNPSIRDEESYYMTQARMYYGEKGERLRDPSGSLAKTLNPLSTLRRATQNAARTGALGDYNTRVIEDWAKAAAPFIDNSSVGLNPSAWETFFNAKFIKGLSPEQDRAVAAMDIARNAHKRFMGMRDLDQTSKAMYLKKLGMELENHGPLGEKAAEAVYSRLNADPVGVARDLVFHGYFGFMNLRRFVLHASQAVGAIAVDPVRGLNAAGMALPTAVLVHVNRGDKVLEYFANKLGAGNQLGMAINDYKDMVRSLRYSGWLNVGGEVAQLDRYADRLGGTALTKGWDVVKNTGVLPFHAAIGLQRLMGYHMAWSMAKELMPEEKVFGPKFQGWVNNMTDALSGNMTTASSAAWQKGAWGIPTQFMSWQARMMENLLPKTFGGSKVLSGQQKARYLFGQSVLWGTSGVPLLGAGYDVISDLYQQNTGKQIDSDTHRTITKGLMDSMIHGFTGSDTDMAGEAGLGAALNRSIDGFASGQYNPMLQFLGGPVVDTGSQAIDKLSHFVTYMKAEQTDGLSVEQFKLAFQDAVPLIQGLKLYQKSYWAWKYHTIYDPKTNQPIIDDATTSDAVMAALGIPNVWETEGQHVWQTQDDIEQTVNDVAKQIVKLRREQSDAFNKGDEDKQTQIENIVRVVMQPYRDRPLMSQQIAKRATEFMTRGYTGTEKEQLIQRSIKNTGMAPPEATTPEDEQ